MSGMSARRGPRSIKQTLGSIILGFEMVVMFLGSLVIFGLKALPAPVALIGGAVLCLIIVATIPLLRFRWGYWLGWAVQAAIVATGLLVPMMFLVGGMAAAVWTYAMVQGDKIERQQAFYREAKD
ncbi:hypothetical protein ASF83_05060 [Plantibacter sp. Leaf171]|uniref:DUF4233 domain-containing protein n=1 Tax=unclassified Plantibacter TaxID=2624265 RepID=UPI0006FCC086|nr:MULTISPECIES: DUF4233 domain-containing protein [unclassified Plantibacter]KQM15352.1 hypothetical protein ASE44_05075 [Plantibacter sp. Leaf1]KQQ51443.1 hypothetical protein ASF68_03040 [Plantibacter sp. Leaf314]KQR58496.1 hypothetical protein ASF83_05060 [Plantibacter sp. Leaf171]